MSIQTTSIDTLPVTEDDKKLYENELITSLQKAASNGMTQLPSRDIPMNTATVHEDEEVRANYIPSIEGDYITKHQTSEEIVRQNAKKQREKDQWDDIFNELSFPLLVSTLYFMYQLPMVRKAFLNTLPMCYCASGEVNLTGRIVNGFVFGAIIYVITKFVSQISN